VNLIIRNKKTLKDYGCSDEDIKVMKDLYIKELKITLDYIDAISDWRDRKSTRLNSSHTT